MAPRIEVDASAARGFLPVRTARDLLRRAVRAALAACDADESELSVALLDDASIAELNSRYLGHEGPTDVISFALHGPGEPVLGDVYVGIEQALRQAEGLRVPPAEELVRLAVHGTLHVLGHSHPEGEGRERSPMWQLQERIVAEVLDR